MTRIEELTKEAASLPKAQRLALARVLLDLEPHGSVDRAEQSWNEEICARIKAVDGGHISGLAYEDLKRELNARYGA
jgi:putative addiction module component (TIGR02574 family)